MQAQKKQIANDWIAKEIDSEMQKQDLTRWVVTLNDDTIVYQDDSGEGELRPNSDLSAWERLQNYCNKNNNYIVSMKLQFRSHIENMPSNAEGYFFRRCLLSGLGSSGLERPSDVFFYLVGILKDGKVHVQKWRTPELLLDTSDVEDIRDPFDYELCGKSLITKLRSS